MAPATPVSEATAPPAPPGPGGTEPLCFSRDEWPGAKGIQGNPRESKGHSWIMALKYVEIGNIPLKYFDYGGFIEVYG